MNDPAFMKLLLFDIDGTLLLSGGAGNRAMDRTFSFLYGQEGITVGCDFSGMTDPAILRDLFAKAHHRDCSEDEMEEMKQTYLRFLEEEVAASKGFRVLPGVSELLGHLSRRRDVLLGLATGNLERGAYLKLKRAGVLDYFRFGGYGSDSENRPYIIVLAIERGRKLLGNHLDGHAAFVIGDTPLDIDAGKRAGAFTVAVATGTKSLEELELHQPTHLLRDFSRAQEFMDLLSPALAKKDPQQSPVKDHA